MTTTACKRILGTGAGKDCVGRAPSPAKACKPPSLRQCSMTRSRLLRQYPATTSTECDEKCSISFLYMRKPPAIAILLQRRCLGGHGMCGCVGRAPSPAKLGSQTYTLLGVMSVTNEHARQICFQNGTRGQGTLFRGRGRPRHIGRGE